MTLEEKLAIYHEVTKIAKEKCKEYSEAYHESPYYEILNIIIDNNYVYFSETSSTSGMTHHEKFPLKYLFEDGIKDYAREQKRNYIEKLNKSKCKTCGHYNFSNNPYEYKYLSIW